MNSVNIINTIATFRQLSFPALLQSLLDEHNKKRPQLYNYLIQRDFWMSQTAMYKYFNPNEGRIPNDYKFVILFAEFLELEPEQQEALLHMWAIKRSRKPHPWETPNGDAD